MSADPSQASEPHVATPSFHTPARLPEANPSLFPHPLAATSNDKGTACQPITATCNSTHTTFAAGTPKAEEASNSFARAAAHAETGKQHRARTRLGNPAFSTPAASQLQEQPSVTPVSAVADKRFPQESVSLPPVASRKTCHMSPTMCCLRLSVSPHFAGAPWPCSSHCIARLICGVLDSCCMQVLLPSQ